MAQILEWKLTKLNNLSYIETETPNLDKIQEIK